MTPAMEKRIASIRREIRKIQLTLFYVRCTFDEVGASLLCDGTWTLGNKSETQLPTIVSGAKIMMLGAVLLFANFWNMQKVIQMELDKIEERNKNRRFHINSGRKRR